MPQPVGAFNFYVSLYAATSSGLSAALQATSTAILSGFAEVSGLDAELETEEYREGGNNAAPLVFTKWGRYSNLTFRRGVTFSPGLWDWYQDARARPAGPPRMNGLIILADHGGVSAAQAALVPPLDRTPVAAWSFRNGLPVKLQGPSLNAMSDQIAIEALEIAHEGLTRLSPNNVPAIADALGSFVI